jgi:hypothetical protein
LKQRGWTAEFVSWRRRDVEWRAFDAVVIRTPWDYQNDPEAFLTALGEIASTGVRLENPLDIVLWNIRKTYLRDLSERGVTIVPTVWDTGVTVETVRSLFDRFAVDEIVLKPVVSANADNTFRIHRTGAESIVPSIGPIFAVRQYMAQPFMPHIIKEGEFSLFYFGGEYSHCILKTPRTDDFRVQEEHGATITSVTPDPALLEAGAKAVSSIGETLLYARPDFVRTDTGEFALMELELIEPSLYFRTDPGAARRFAAALDERVRRQEVR